MEGKEFELGRRLKTCRKRIGLKQEEVGRKIGIGKSMVSDWECGKRVPSVSLLIKLAALYEVPLESLIDIQNAADGLTAAERLSNFVMADTPEDVALYLNISVDNLARMTAGDLDITQEQAEKLAERYGVQPSLFYEENNEEVPVIFPSSVHPISVFDKSENAKEIELITIYRDLNDKGQFVLMGTARGLAANPEMNRQTT